MRYIHNIYCSIFPACIIATKGRASEYLGGTLLIVFHYDVIMAIDMCFFLHRIGLTSMSFLLMRYCLSIIPGHHILLYT